MAELQNRKESTSSNNMSPIIDNTTQNNQPQKTRSKTDFDVIFLKINKIKEKHKTHENDYPKDKFCLNNYNISACLKDNKVKELWHLLEPNYSYLAVNQPQNISKVTIQNKFNKVQSSICNTSALDRLYSMLKDMIQSTNKTQNKIAFISNHEYTTTHANIRCYGKGERSSWIKERQNKYQEDINRIFATKSWSKTTTHCRSFSSNSIDVSTRAHLEIKDSWSHQAGKTRTFRYKYNNEYYKNEMKRFIERLKFTGMYTRRAKSHTKTRNYIYSKAGSELSQSVNLNIRYTMNSG